MFLLPFFVDLYFEKNGYFSKICLHNDINGYQLHTVAKFQANLFIIHRVSQDWSQAICNCIMYNACGGFIFFEGDVFIFPPTLIL